jgi:hypothetical protein
MLPPRSACAGSSNLPAMVCCFIRNSDFFLELLLYKYGIIELDKQVLNKQALSYFVSTKILIEM